MDMTSGTKTPQAKHSASYEENFKNVLEGMHIHFPEFKHEQHGPIVNVNKEVDDRLTLGQKVADKVASGMGSWGFIITQACLLALWIVFNSIAWFYHFDNYPYILLNLVLSFQAGFAAPVIMMSQNRQAEKDRLTAQNDYATDCKGEEEIRHIMDHLDHQDTLILQIVQRLEAQNERIAQQEKLTFEIVQHLDAQNERMKVQHQEMLDVLNRLNPEMAQRMKDESD